MRGHGRARSLVVKTCGHMYDPLKNRPHASMRQVFVADFMDKAPRLRQRHLLTLHSIYL